MNCCIDIDNLNMELNGNKSILDIWFLGFITWVLGEQKEKKAVNLKKTIPPQLVKSISTALEQEVRYKKGYLKPDLTLNDLSKATGYPVYILSTVLNNFLNKSFNNYINEMRIEEAKKELRSGALKKKTIIAVALDAGFNSKSSFNRLFKKYTGITPSQYAAGENGKPVFTSP